jgi:uncharacterized protein
MNHPLDRFLPPESAGRTPLFRIGVLSDTHFGDRLRQLPPVLHQILAGVDLLIHAGDVGTLTVLDELSAIAPVVAVHGNDDSAEAQRDLPFQQTLMAAGRRIFLWHSHHADPKEELASRQGDEILPKLERTVHHAQQAGARLAIFGHWHIPLDVEVAGVRVINPGALAAGNFFTRQSLQSCGVLYLFAGGENAFSHINLADPARRYAPGFDPHQRFSQLLARFSDSIISPLLTARLRVLLGHLTPRQVALLRVVATDQAHRVWAGEAPELTLAMLREAALADARVDEEVKRSLAALAEE